MKEELDFMKYYQAAEKVQNMVYTIEITLQYMEEFEIKPDDDVKAAVKSVMNKLNRWVDGK